MKETKEILENIILKQKIKKNKIKIIYNKKTSASIIKPVLKLMFSDFEIILVDDGSPDNSGAICDEYAKKYPNKSYLFFSMHNVKNSEFLRGERSQHAFPCHRRAAIRSRSFRCG